MFVINITSIVAELWFDICLVETFHPEVIISCQFISIDLVCDYCNKSTYSSFKVTIKLVLYCCIGS